VVENLISPQRHRERREAFLFVPPLAGQTKIFCPKRLPRGLFSSIDISR
jgi:hypothetical protein